MTFFTLAATINETVAKVRAALQRQFADLANSQQIAKDLMAQVSASTQQHRQEVAATLSTSRTQLCALGTAITNSGAGAAELVQLNLAVSRHIGGMVMAQQCQDITRQRLEHVGEALDEMRGLLVDEGTGATTDHSQFIGQAAQIQWKQAASVFAELNRAADSLKEGIQSLRSEAGAAAKAAIQVGDSALDARFSSQCQAGISQILATVKQAVQKIAEITTAFAPLQASFANCTSQASQLAGDVRLAALNAQIFALHATNGGTLEVLAGRVRVISDDTLQNVETMGIALRRTDEMVSHLRERLADFQHIGQAEQVVLAEESELSLQKLADLESAIPGLIQRITQQQGIFVQSAEQVLAEVKFPATVATANSRSTDFFRDLIKWSGADQEGAAKTPPQLERLAQKYTMESERQVHAAALHPVPASSPENSPAFPEENSGSAERMPTDAPEPAFATSSMGENVELF